MIQVRLFHIPRIRLAYVADQTVFNIKDDKGKEKRTDELMKIATSIRDKIQACREKGCASESLSFKEKLVNDMAAMHADTWIEGVALHTMEYSTKTKSDRPDHHVLDEAGNRNVRNKRISGDVSGVIGETLFSVVLREHYEMDEYSDYCHLIKPNRMRYPDFGIIKPSSLFIEEMKNRSVFTHYSNITIPCEVKTFSSFEYKPLDRIRDAADQLVSFWYSKKLTEGVGVICIPILNTDNGSYDLFFVWCY